jgi:hypothetical protein
MLHTPPREAAFKPSTPRRAHCADTDQQADQLAALAARGDNCRITNQTAKRIEIASADDPSRPGLRLAPFATSWVQLSLLDSLDYRCWRDRRLIKVEPPWRSSAESAGDGDSEYQSSGTRGPRSGGRRIRAALREARYWLSQLLNKTVLLVIMIGLPLLLFVLSGFGGTLPDWLAPIAERANGRMIARVIQFTFIAIASSMPALLYLLFRSQKVDAIRNNFIRDMMTLDPAVYTTDEARSRYGALVDEVYGAGEYGYRLLGPGLPVIISTLLITLGWFLTLPIISDPPPLSDGAQSVFALFNPNHEVFIFGFLGAYFFSINMIFRRYILADLAPKAYSHIILRILVVTIVVWVVSVLVGKVTGSAEDGAWMVLPLAFVIGILPETGMTLIFDSLKQLPWIKTLSPSLAEEQPLTQLEGMNLYDQARLLEEGIENVENLAHHSLPSLMLRTRIATPRLIDHVDQAILYLHLGPAPGSGASGKESMVDTRGRLRAYGIRTATDLEQTALAAKGRGDEEWEAFLRLLPPSRGEDPRPAISRVRTILDALQVDEWMSELRRRRDSRSAGGARIWRFEDFYPA